MTRLIDLRSDTVTRPTGAMRRAMADAEVGDDWYGDDPTVNRLEERCAQLTGKEAAVYVATGTMANQIALHVFVRPGSLVVAESHAHVATTEVTSSAVLSGIGFLGLDSPQGLMTAAQVAEALQPDPHGVDVVDLVAVENTHQVGGGRVMPVDELRSIRKAAGEFGIPVYIDGARIFNATAASGTPVGDYAAEADALMFSLSKGLGAPVGSVLCGSDEFVKEARRTKILFGGAWRQAGVLAAAGLVALDEGPAQLQRDHSHARRLAEGISGASPGAVDPARVETNIVFADAAALGLAPFEALSRLRAEGVLANVVAGKLRFVTHRDVSAADVDEAIMAWRRVGSATAPAEA